MLGYRFWGTKFANYYFLFYGMNGKLIAFFDTERKYSSFLTKFNIMHYEIRWLSNCHQLDFDFNYVINNCKNREMDDIFFSETQLDSFNFNRSKNLWQVIKKFRVSRIK